MAASSAAPGHALYFAYGSNLSPTQMAARCPQSMLVGVAQLTGYTWVINKRGYANVVDVKRLYGPQAPHEEPNIVRERPQYQSTEASTGNLGKEINKQEEVVSMIQSTMSASSPSVTLPAEQSELEASEAALTSGVTTAADEASVYGLLYSLPPQDEDRLDRAEGVPHCYGKEWLPVQVWLLESTATSDNTSTAKVAELGRIEDPFLLAEESDITSKQSMTSQKSFHAAGNSRSSVLHTSNSTESPSAALNPPGRAIVKGRGDLRCALVYVDRERITPGQIKTEYIRRMQRGVVEAGDRGCPAAWMGRVIMPWLKNGH